MNRPAAPGDRHVAPSTVLPALPRYPSLLEINTRVWIRRLSQEAGRPITLADIGNRELDDLAGHGFDWVWLLSVWQTGPAGRAISRSMPGWRAECQAVLPDLTDEDICGSGFAITAYEVSEALGGRAALAELRARLARRGIRLMLDFVPNHTALDHPWVKSNPDFYIQGREEDLAVAPENYCRIQTNVGERIMAHGRDPNFAGWPDTLQLNHANPALQARRITELACIAAQCDGLRCDMAMLLLPEVFRRTWGLAAEPFWPKAISAVRRAHPDFTFLAEVYWDLEAELQSQGFDYCYDKRLYDRLRSQDAGTLRAHLRASLDYQDRLARFLENHDEPRAATSFPWPRHQAAAMVAFFAPGLRIFQEGQSTGARLRPPVHLCRGPMEPRNAAIAAFYARLQAQLAPGGAFRDGQWSLVEPAPAWEGNPTWTDFVAYAWRARDERCYVIVVNYSDHQGQCYLRLPFPELAGARVRLMDEMGSEVYERAGDDLVGAGLYIDLQGWRYNLFRLERL
jgi:alpha amylase-like protein